MRYNPKMLKSDKIKNLRDLEKLRVKKIAKYKSLSFEEYLKVKEEIDDNYLFYSAYEFFMDKEYRQKTGAVYTPQWVVEYMVDSSLDEIEKRFNSLKSVKVLDPCCGSGNYTQILIEKISERIYKKTKEEKQKVLEYVINEVVYSEDINEEALGVCKKRIEDLFGVKPKNVKKGNFLKSDKKYDLIIGNPPYGDLLSDEDKKELKDSYKNIALNFIDKAIELINENGEISMIVPHSFTRVKDYKAWREKVKKDKSLHKVVDVGNPFSDITLEEVIFSFNKNKNENIKTYSLKDLGHEKVVKVEDFYNKFNSKMVIYYDEFYKKINELNKTYPFSGKRGHDISKSELEKEKSENNKWIILGKNIQKNKLVHIENYDRYIPKQKEKEKYNKEENRLVITQFGTNLKAAIITKEEYPSGGVVIVGHENIGIEEAKEYLNMPEINHYLKKYIFNDADLTVHIDGIYLSEIPYVGLNELEKLKKWAMKKE